MRGPGACRVQPDLGHDQCLPDPRDASEQQTQSSQSWSQCGLCISKQSCVEAKCPEWMRVEALVGAVGGGVHVGSVTFEETWGTWNKARKLLISFDCPGFPPPPPFSFFSCKKSKLRLKSKVSCPGGRWQSTDSNLYLLPPEQAVALTLVNRAIWPMELCAWPLCRWVLSILFGCTRPTNVYSGPAVWQPLGLALGAVGG